MSSDSFRILSSDVACWQFIGELGCLDTATIHRRCYPSITLRGCQRRLRLASQDGFLRTASLAVCYQPAHLDRRPEQGGAVPSLHAITDKAADVVERETGQRPARVLRSEPAAATFLHRWEVVLHRVAWDEGLRLVNLSPATWIMEQDPWPDAPDGLPPNQRRMLYHRFEAAPKAVTCQPDAACLLRVSRPADLGDCHLLHLWEIDRSSEGLKQIERKLPGYAQYVRTKAWTRYFPELNQPQIRLMWVAPSAERIANLISVIRDSPVANLCRFAVAREVTAESIFTAPIWQGVDGELRSFRFPQNRG